MFLLFFIACWNINNDLQAPTCVATSIADSDPTPWGPSVADYLDDAMVERNFDVAWETDLVGAGETSFAATLISMDSASGRMQDCESPSDTIIEFDAAFDVRTTRGDLLVDSSGIAGEFQVTGGLNGFVIPTMAPTPSEWEEDILAALQASGTPGETVPSQLLAYFNYLPATQGVVGFVAYGWEADYEDEAEAPGTYGPWAELTRGQAILGL